MSKFMLSCGGTGGHLSPGIALAEGLRARGHSVTLLISQKRVDARLVEKYRDLRFRPIAGSPLSYAPASLTRCLFTQTRGFLQCLRLVRAERPDCILGFGGFTSAPLVVAGAFNRIPVALHEANRVPGRAVRVLARLARRVYLPPGVNLRQAHPASIRPMGLPVRREIMRLPVEGARQSLGLLPNARTLVVLGGSQGAGALNEWVRRELDTLVGEGIQIYCVTGLGKDHAETREFHSRKGQPVRVVFTPFCDKMAELLSAADLVVSRAGAGTIAELMRCITPAILVPYPQSADDHQRANAAFFERQGGGIVLEQAFLATLRAEVTDAIFNDWLLAKFRDNLHRMDREHSLEQMLSDLEVLASPGSRRSQPPAAATQPA